MLRDGKRSEGGRERGREKREREKKEEEKRRKRPVHNLRLVNLQFETLAAGGPPQARLFFLNLKKPDNPPGFLLY